MKKKEYAVITGGSGGIGLEIGLQLAKKGYNLILVSRSQERLDEAEKQITSAHKNTDVKTIVADLTKTTHCKQTAYDIEQLKVSVSVFVNNAGFGLWGEFGSIPITKQLDMLKLNIEALTYFSHWFTTYCYTRNITGYLQNIGSSAGFQPGPYMSAYYASKAYVLQFSQGIREEVSKYGISVSCVCPGPVATNFEKVSGVGKSNLFKLAKPIKASFVAQKSVEGMFAGKAVITPGVSVTIGTMIGRILPTWLSAKVTKSIQKPS